MYLYLESEKKPKYLGKHFIQQPSSYADSGFDFYVKLNGVIMNSDQLNQLKSLINYYKLAGKRYQIVN
ncbi:hypothetical protein D3C78_1686270 [compost metagenome]